MRTFFLMSVVLIAGSCGVFAELPAGWNTNFTNALATAKAQQQPVLAYFTASWCGPCKLMAHSTLTNELVVQTLAKFSHVAVDIDEHHDLAEAYGVRAVPTFHLLTPVGDEVSTTTGYQDAARFLQWLTNGVREVEETVVRRKESEKMLANADQLLHQTDSESLRKAASQLIDLCADRETAITEAAIERLSALAKHDPALLLAGLSHPRLAARIRVANVLRTLLGEAFDVDPWSDATTRQEGITHWREKLSNLQPTAGRTP